MDFKKANKYIERMIFDGEIYNYYGRTQEKYKDMVGYFSEYFDTSRMNCSDVYNFLYNKEDETHRIYRVSVKNTTLPCCSITTVKKSPGLTKATLKSLYKALFSDF